MRTRLICLVSLFIKYNCYELDSRQNNCSFECYGKIYIFKCTKSMPTVFIAYEYEIPNEILIILKT